MSSILSGLGPFHLLEILGEGKRATVYRARHEGDDHEVALKVLHVPVAADAFERRSVQERSAAAMGLKGSNVVRTLDTGLIDGRPYLTMPLVEGLSLDRLPRRGAGFRLKAGQAANVVHGLLEALLEAWQSDPPLVHDRLDDGALMITTEGELAILGFGTAGPGQTDLRAVAELSQRLTASWPTEMDAFLDELQAGEGFVKIADALEAFPLPLEAKDRTALGRTIKRRIRALAETPDSAIGPVSEEPENKQATKLQEASDRPRRKRRPTLEGLVASRQARWVALTCGGLVALAFVLEIFTLPG